MSADDERLIDDLTERIGADADRLAELLLGLPHHSPDIVLALLGATVCRVARRLPAERREATLREWLAAFEDEAA